MSIVIMKSAFRQLILILISATIALSAPAGICLHAYSPEAPADKIECFEFTRVEKVANGYRFFLEPNGTAVVTKYRYHGIIYYMPELVPGDPNFQQLLEQYEKTARAMPSARRFLNPRIVNMRFMAAEQSAKQQFRETLPKIEIAGVTFLEPVFKGFEEGKLILKHRDGNAKIELEKITDDHLQTLVKIDTRAAGIKVTEIAKHRLWNPRFEGITKEKVNIAHEKGILSLGFESISEKDKKTIMAWSDGTWKIAKPGLYSPKSSEDSYGELILDNGRFHTNVKLTERKGEDISVKTSKTTLKLPIQELIQIKGLSAQDFTKIETWVNEIIDESLSRATPVADRKVISFDKAEVLKVTNIRVLILQVLDEGVLASKFVGVLHKGTEKVQTTKTVTVEHPITGVKIGKVIDSSIDYRAVIEDVTDDLCYIVGNTSNLVDGEVVKADSMRLLGRYQYTDVRGAQRSVRKYHVD